MANEVLLSVRDVSKVYPGRRSFTALDKVSLELHRGETLGIVGESGSGKTTIAKIIAGIFEASSGEMTFDGHALGYRRPREVRKQIQYIYQEPVAALDPMMTVERILAEPLQLYYGLGRAQCREKVDELLEEVGLDPEETRAAHPRQLSGGQCQRVGIARALAGDPRIVVCDEPTSALDATVQTKVLDLMKRLKEKKGLSYVFITHNLGVVKEMSDRVIVMRQGEVVERGDVGEVFSRPREEYTKTLLASVPRLDIPRYDVSGNGAVTA